MKISRLSFEELPLRLRQAPSPARRLYYAGSLELLERTSLSVIGSRKATPYGRQITQQLVAAVASQGVIIVSGLALGIDSEAHRAALAAGGRTIAVLPSGLDRIYPATHYGLAQQIVKQGGLLVSEYRPEVRARKEYFIARNRIISGLSGATLIIEAGDKSGTLHTANFALEQGRDVLAVPGNINVPSSFGVNNLIKSGATPITCTQDLLDCFGLEDQTIKPKASSKEEQLLLDLLAQGITSSNQLLEASQLTPAKFNQTLTILEGSGLIKSPNGSQWSL